MSDKFRRITGTAEANNGAADATVIAAQSGERLMVLQGFVVVRVAAAGGGGEVALEDGVGGTRFFVADADAVGYFPIDFGETGYPLTIGNLLNLTVDSAVTTQATARATLIARVI